MNSNLTTRRRRQSPDTMTQTAKVADRFAPRAIGPTVGWVVFGIAFVIRLGVGMFRGGLWNPELFEYDWMARTLIDGQGLVFPHLNVPYHSFAPPLYPWLSAASYWLSGSLIVLMMLQVVAGSALAVVVAQIAKRFSASAIATLAAGLLIAFHPGLIIYNVAKAHPLTFDALFFTLAVLQAFRLRERTTVRRAIEFGAIVGVGTLSRATLIIFLPLVAMWLVWVLRKDSLKLVVRAIVVAGLCATAIVIPWTIRTSLLHRQFVFMLTTGPENFWRGNNPNATGGAYFAAGQLELEKLSPAELADLRNQRDEIAQANWFTARSHAFIREHPGEFIRLTVVKLFHFWWVAPQTGVLYPQPWFLAYLMYYVLALLLAMIGAWSIWRMGKLPRQQLLLIAAFLLALSVLQSLYYVEGRHRWAVEPILIAISGVGVASIANSRHRFATRT
ncbi:MAG TPA: glycosyltransferase family 39 protein [Pyrinomonadaceae bacterium]|jgi:4-amino-4-deoxy-L-arabinose transferase-like glycosyltransferase